MILLKIISQYNEAIHKYINILEMEVLSTAITPEK